MYGGLTESIELAAEMAGLENYTVQSLPKLDNAMTAIMKQITGSSMVRADRILKRELGEEYIQYRKLQDIRKMHGIQAIMPYDIHVH